MLRIHWHFVVTQILAKAVVNLLSSEGSEALSPEAGSRVALLLAENG